MTLTAEEQVLVVPTSRFHELGRFQGFCRDVDAYLPALLQADLLSYRPRSRMEQDPTFKQIIPYVLFRHVDRSGQAFLFQYRRGGGQGEVRLRARRSVGVGGHISSLDVRAGDAQNVYREGLARELSEEVRVGAPYVEQCVGLINDDQTPVGQVHLGIVHLCDIEAPSVSPAEEDMLEAGFMPVAALLAALDEFETWSQIALRALFSPRIF